MIIMYFTVPFYEVCETSANIRIQDLSNTKQKHKMHGPKLQNITQPGPKITWTDPAPVPGLRFVTRTRSKPDFSHTKPVQVQITCCRPNVSTSLSLYYAFVLESGDETCTYTQLSVCLFPSQRPYQHLKSSLFCFKIFVSTPNKFASSAQIRILSVHSLTVFPD